MNKTNAQSAAALISFLTLTDYKETRDKALNPVKLGIIEQPQEHCRYRYKSEMNKQGGSHGPLYGNNSSPINRTFPSVELYNYTKEARIRAKLIQSNSYFDHPHTLTEHDYGMDVYEMVSEENGYVATFTGLKVINTEKNKLYSVVLEKCKRQLERASKTYSQVELERICKEHTQGRNKPSQNNLRLMFSAHDPVTDDLICKPVVSDVINNIKSAETNCLKIVKSSITRGKPVGDDELILLVEKVQRDNIKVNFLEVNDENEVIWQESAPFLTTDVHKQYAIVCRTPPYKEKQLEKEVKVFIELIRPSDSKTSSRLSFTYIPNRIRDRSYSSFGSSLGSFVSIRDIPQPALLAAQDVTSSNNIEISTVYTTQDQVMMETGNLLADAIQAKYAIDNDYEMSCENPMMDVNSTASLPAGLNSNPSLPKLVLDSSEFPFPKLSIEEVTQMNNVDWEEYSETDADVFRDFVRQERFFTSDSGKPYKPDETTEVKEENTSSGSDGEKEIDTINSPPTCDSSNDGEKRPVKVYSNRSRVKNVEEVSANRRKSSVCGIEDGADIVTGKATEVVNVEEVVGDSETEDSLVKMLLPEFCVLIKNNANNVNQKQIKDKLEEIFKYRFANGATFLHWAINTRKFVNVEVLVKYLAEFKMNDILNVQDKEGQTLLHYAVIRNMHQHIDLFISIGCSPAITDDMGDTPLHIAVLRKRCVKELVDAIKKYNVDFDFDAKNAEGHTPLYLACVHQSLESVRVLSTVSTSLGQPEDDGTDETNIEKGIRTPLHLAALTHDLNVFTALLDTGLKMRNLKMLLDKNAKMSIKDNYEKIFRFANVDQIDQRGYTALQILCGGEMKEHTLEIATMLLKNGADPALKLGTRQSALELCYDKQELCDLLYKYVDGVEVKLEYDIKSEFTDYDTAEEDVIVLEDMKLETPENQLEGLSAFRKPVSDILDESGKWRELATKLGMESLINMLAEAPSPTTLLLDQVKIVDPLVTSPSIAKILFEMDEREAGQIMLDYVDV